MSKINIQLSRDLSRKNTKPATKIAASRN